MTNIARQRSIERRLIAVSRRDFLKAGTVATVCAAAPTAVGASPFGVRQRSLIHIYLPGGPSHLETFDLKHQAPAEVRGEFRPIRTNTSGIEICELLPGLARWADRFTIFRSVTGCHDEHSPRLSDSGWSADSLHRLGGRPGIGAVLSALQGPYCEPCHERTPISVDLTGWANTGFLGDRAAIFEPSALKSEANDSRLRRRSERRTSHIRGSGLRLIRRDGEGRRDSRYRQVAGWTACRALDVSEVGAAARDKYGLADRGENALFLQAGRLIGAGVRCVAFAWGYWDTHGNAFGQLRRQLPALDRGLCALLDDLDQRGQLEDTLIFMSGEFGRTPRINGGAGRDHWPEVSAAFVAGGGLPHGRIVGRTDAMGRFPIDPVPMQSVFATVYDALGVDAASIELTDSRGRRHPVLGPPEIQPLQRGVKVDRKVLV